MSIIRYSIIFLFLTFSSGFAEEVKKIGKFKDWEVIQVLDTSGKICFAQSKPVLQSPKKGDREARLFVTFRPCLLYTSPSPRDRTRSRMPSSA